MNQKYINFNYDNFTEKGLKEVVAAFKSEKSNVLKVEATNKQKRVGGMPTKSATLFFEDGQSLTLLVTSEGSIYQVKLNNRVIPVRNVDNLKKAVSEISGKVKANSKRFIQNLARQTKKKHREDKGGGKKKAISNAIPARLKSAKIMLVSARADLDKALKSTADKKTLHAEKLTEQARLNDELNAESTRNKDLLSQIKELKAA